MPDIKQNAENERNKRGRAPIGARKSPERVARNLLDIVVLPGPQLGPGLRKVKEMKLSKEDRDYVLKSFEEYLREAVQACDGMNKILITLQRMEEENEKKTKAE